MSSTRPSTMAGLFLLLTLGLAACSGEKGVCIIGGDSAEEEGGGVCFANYDKKACEGKSVVYHVAATPAAGVSKCKSLGYTEVTATAGSPVTQADQEKTFAEGGTVSFTKPFRAP